MLVKYKYDMDAIETEMYAIMGRGVMTMKIKELFYTVKPPCPKCPYTLGQIRTVTDPCPSVRQMATSPLNSSKGNSQEMALFPKMRRNKTWIILCSHYIKI